MFSWFLLYNQWWTHIVNRLWHIFYHISQTALQHSITMCYILTVVTHALVICLICMHSPSGLQPLGSCIHIRQITCACDTTITYIICRCTYITMVCIWIQLIWHLWNMVKFVHSFHIHYYFSSFHFIDVSAYMIMIYLVVWQILKQPPNLMHSINTSA